jgi:acetyltransferase-like isoleucine patch superfamily enzyme
LGFLIKILFSGKRIKIGRGFKCHGFPDFNVTDNGRLTIGDNVEVRKFVEFRCHGNSKMVIGDNCRLDRSIRLLTCNESKLELGNNVRIGLGTVFGGGDSITIGNDVLISGYCYIQTSMHKFETDQAISSQGYTHGTIVLGDNCWLGTHAVIFPHVVLGEKCIVGSNAVVTKSFESKSILVGVPAKLRS